MAKVTGPLFSIGARGKLGKAIVYSAWKGINVVREYLKPANPQTGDQGDRRVMLGGLGRAPKYVQTESVFEGHAKAVAPSGQSWISYFVKYIMTTYFANVAGYDALDDELLAHDNVAKFNSEAAALGLTEFNLTYKSMDEAFTPGLQLYCLAKFATDQYLLDNTKFNTVPYEHPLADWNPERIELFVADFTPV